MKAGDLFAMGLIDELSHALFAYYRKNVDPQVLREALRWFGAAAGGSDVEKLLGTFGRYFSERGGVSRGGDCGTIGWRARRERCRIARRRWRSCCCCGWRMRIRRFLDFKELFDDAPMGERDGLCEGDGAGG